MAMTDQPLAQNMTIYALSTPLGRGALAVIRVSGSLAFESLQALILDQALPPLREGRVRKLYCPETKRAIDSALVLTFKAPHSFTGEDCVEYHVHGGVAVINGLLSALAAMKGHRMAEPGEFTRRGFEHGKFDLTEAEAIADLIAAETEWQRLQALEQLEGGLETLYRGWAQKLSHVLALMEADLDFNDQDLPDDLLLRVRPDLSSITASIKEHLNDGRRGERLRNGFQLVLLGAPNVGKSSLLNHMTARDVVITSPLAGTTRDIVEAHLDIGGYPIILADMAGVHKNVDIANPHGAIEQIGIERAAARVKTADIILHVFDATRLPDYEPDIAALYDPARSLFVLNKADLFDGALPEALKDALPVSAKAGTGFEELFKAITNLIEQKWGTKRDAPSLTRARHREALEDCVQALNRIETALLPELAAEDVRLALRALGRLTGRVDVEDLLDMIFRDFCIGK